MIKNENHERYFWIGLALTLVLLGGLVAAWLREPTQAGRGRRGTQPDQPQTGRQLYVDNCTSCHGSRGEGVVGPALNNKTLLKKASNEILFATIKLVVNQKR